MTRKNIFLTILLLLSAACTAPIQDTSGVNKTTLAHDYLTDVRKEDGIDRREALLLAQNEILFRAFENSFDIQNPGIFLDNNELWGIRFPTHKKTMEEALSGRVIDVYIRKEDGHIAVQKNF